MIRVVNENGPAEGATSPGHGSNNTSKETAVNDQHDTTANGGAARARRHSANFDTWTRVPGPECRVLTLAPLLKHLREEANRHERQSFHARAADQDGRGLRHDRAAAHVYDQEAAVRDIIAACEACSLEGVAIQIGDLLARFDLLLEDVEPKNEYTFRAETRRIVRLLYSILRGVEGHIVRDMDEVVDRGFFERDMDPWGAMAEVGEDAGSREEAA